jgi:putative restriction endonuclease
MPRGSLLASLVLVAGLAAVPVAQARERAELSAGAGEGRVAAEAENILCLCPNHHVLFDNGAFGVNDDLTLIGLRGRLVVHKRHPLGLHHLAHHRERFGLG